MRRLPHLLLPPLALFVVHAPLGQAASTAPANAISAHVGIHAVTNVAPRQAGYVHYFRITHPDNTLEDQVGIELDDQRIAWSFPGAGVIVSEFVKQGELRVGESTYTIQHLHGLRPLKSEKDMQVLRNELARRVAFWVEDETPYCVFRKSGMPFCLNCGDFVARILFPSTLPMLVGFPEDLIRTPANLSSPDDLLLYMLGLHSLPDTQSRMAKLATMDLPESLRRDVQEMLLPESPVIAALPAATDKKPLPRIANRKPQNRRL